MQGVQPNANAKPSKKPLNTPAKGPDLRSWSVRLPRVRKCMSRFSQRVSVGPARKISETEISCCGVTGSGSKPLQMTRLVAASSKPTIRPTRTGIRLSTPIRESRKER